MAKLTAMVFRLTDSGRDLTKAVLDVTRAYGLTLQEMEMLYNRCQAKAAGESK